MDFINIVQKVSNENKIIPAFNVFGYEDSMSIVKAAEKLNCPVILMTNKDAIKILDVSVWGAMLKSIADGAKVPVGVHLDHCVDENIVKKAIEAGYKTVMYDGSQLPFEENVRKTKLMADYAHEHGVGIEGEIGSVPYSDKPGEYLSVLTDPVEAESFQKLTGIDWMAISVGNVHKLAQKKVAIKFDILEQIEKVTSIPLVIHGATGITNEDILKLRTHRVGKINIGTAIRYAFGTALRESVNNSPNVFDRLELLKNSSIAVEEKTEEILELLYK